MTALVLILYLILVAGFLVVGWFVFSAVENAIRNLPPFLPSSSSVVRKLPSILVLNKNSVFYDIGSGSGKVVLAMAKAYPENKCVGIERGSFQLYLARLKLLFHQRTNVSFVRRNFFTTPLVDATHVYMYLLPHTVQKLFPKLLAELRPGSIVVSCDFPYEKKDADKKIEIRGNRLHTLYVYHL